MKCGDLDMIKMLNDKSETSFLRHSVICPNRNSQRSGQTMMNSPFGVFKFCFRLKITDRSCSYKPVSRWQQ